MRTLFEIIEAAKIGEPTTHEECLYALLAYAGLAYFDSSALRQLAFKPSKFLTPEREVEESHRRWKMALDKSPKDWLGPGNDPANEECRTRVKMARRLFEKVLATHPIEGPAQNSDALDLQTTRLERITQQLAQLPAHELELFEQMAQQAARPDRVEKESEP